MNISDLKKLEQEYGFPLFLDSQRRVYRQLANGTLSPIAIAQGDVFFTLVPASRRPADLGKLVSPTADNKHIVAHSETGHHHVMDGDAVDVYETNNPLISFLEVLTSGDAVVTHLRDYDTHAPVALPGIPGELWQKTLQRESTPEGWIRVQD